MAKVTGIGGVFFKSKGDHAALAAWYRKHLGMALEDFGNSSFTINYRVDNLGELLEQLRRGGWQSSRDPNRTKWQVCVDHGPRRQQGRALGAKGLGRQE